MTTRILPRSIGSTTLARPLQLTRRGRFVLVGLPLITGTAALIVIAVIFLMPSTVKASTNAVEGPITRTVTVQPDETLWNIAMAADPQRDTREVMADIAELNDLSSSALTVGQSLEVPAP